MTKMTKVEQAKTIVASNPAATRSELVKMFMEQIGMSKAGASTYAFNLAKDAPKRVKKMAEAVVHAAVKAKKAKKEVEAVVVVPATREEAAFDKIAKLAAKRARDAARKREKRAAAKAAKDQAALAA